MELEHTVKIKEHSVIALIAAKKLGKANVAIVLGRTIYLYGISRAEFLKDTCWVRHELEHVRQFEQYGFLPFIYRYLAESLHKGYYNNRFEVQARNAESGSSNEEGF